MERKTKRRSNSGVRSNPSTPRSQKDNWEGINSDGYRESHTGKPVVLRKLKNAPGEKSNIQVSVRVRPLSRREIEKDSTVVTSVSNGTISVDNLRGGELQSFTFDHAYDMDSTQVQIYEDIGFSIVQNAIEGYNCCIISYGQTGSGKSHTMMGSEDDSGLIPRIARALIQQAEQKKLVDDGWEGHFEVSYYEIYAEKIYDLLSSLEEPLKARYHDKKGVYVEKLKYVAVSSYADIIKVMEKGNKSRSVASTLLNTQSSRSHAVFTITFKQYIYGPERKKLKEKKSVINLVDLAGSEKVSASGVEGINFKEATYINKSLLTLGQVITVLVKNQTSSRQEHIPFRESILTWLLSDSFGGNSKTVIIATISPSHFNLNESLSTLRYAYNAKRIVNTVVINEDSDNELILALQREIEELRSMGNSEELEERQRILEEAQKTWEAKLQESQQELEHEQSTVQQLEVERQNLADKLAVVMAQRDNDMLLIKEQTRLEVENMVVQQITELKEQFQLKLQSSESDLSALRRKYNQLEHDCIQKSRQLDLLHCTHNEVKSQLAVASEQKTHLNSEVNRLTELISVKSTEALVEISKLSDAAYALETKLKQTVEGSAEIQARLNDVYEQTKIAETKHIETIVNLQNELDTLKNLQHEKVLVESSFAELSTRMAAMTEKYNALEIEMEESRRENAKLVETVTQLKAENAEFNNLKIELQARIEELESAVNSVPVTVENGIIAEPVTIESASIESASIVDANTEITIHEVDEGTVCGKTYKELEDENISMRNFIDRLKSEHASIFDQLQGTLSEKDQELIKQREQVQSLTRANQQRIKQMLRVINALKQMEKEVAN